MRKDATDYVKIIEKQYFNDLLSVNDIAIQNGLTVRAVQNVVNKLSGGLEKISFNSPEDDINNEKIKNRAKKRLEFLEKLENGDLVKKDYANDWSKPSGELVTQAIMGQLALGYSQRLVYSNLLDRITNLLQWQDKEMQIIMQEISTDTLTGYKASEKVKAIKDIVTTQLKAMGIKSDKALSDMIDKIGNLTVSEERLMTEKAKAVIDESNTEKQISLLQEIAGVRLDE